MDAILVGKHHRRGLMNNILLQTIPNSEAMGMNTIECGYIWEVTEYTCIHTCIYTCIHTYVYTSLPNYIQTYRQTHTNIQKYIQT